MLQPSSHSLTCATLVSDENRKFELTGVPAGQHEIVVWHEGSVAPREGSL